mgnify:CR=1 FL=1
MPAAAEVVTCTVVIGSEGYTEVLMGLPPIPSVAAGFSVTGSAKRHRW